MIDNFPKAFFVSFEKFLNELPPLEDWGERVYTRPELQYPESLNAAVPELLDRNIWQRLWCKDHDHTKDEVITYNELLQRVSKIVLRVEKLSIEPGDQFYSRFPNNRQRCCVAGVSEISGVAVMIMTVLRGKRSVTAQTMPDASWCSAMLAY